MLLEHDRMRPRIAPSAYVAPTAVVSGDVNVGDDARVLFGAVITADGGPVEVGARTIVMENAVVRGRADHPTSIGEHVVVGPHAHVNGAVVGANAFLATGVSVFPGAVIGAGAEIRINGVVHVNTALPPDALVPIGWIAVGDPAEIFPPDEHDRIWMIQRELDFPRTVFGVERAAAAEMMPVVAHRYAEMFGRHRDDRILDA
ncbi:MAG: gamma carbonic anhydrase family protein [Actinomycetota bacterium]|nr:gamma carbonic anhydrase family protein [Actinomycetota bacterium]